jgi:anti-sigma28 factor (negative regulator of flagellin synthesis)
MEFNKINKINSNAINSYKAVKSTKTAVSASAESKPSGNFDKVEFSFAEAMASAKANIASNVAAEANIAKIRQLQADYAGENCPVSSAKIAQAILGE